MCGGRVGDGELTLLPSVSGEDVDTVSLRERVDIHWSGVGRLRRDNDGKGDWRR
jgi:hypothetical protein